MCILYEQLRPACRPSAPSSDLVAYSMRSHLLWQWSPPGRSRRRRTDFLPGHSQERNMTLIGVPRETAAGERRVALVPKVVERLHAAGLAVVVETGAGTGALIPDEQYEQAGATIGDPWPADLVVKVNPPTADEIGLLKPESTIVGFLAPRTRP